MIESDYFDKVLGKFDTSSMCINVSAFPNLYEFPNSGNINELISFKTFCHEKTHYNHFLLSLFSPIHSAFRRGVLTESDIIPGQRFTKALQCSLDYDTPSDYGDDYNRFQSQICKKLEWNEPKHFYSLIKSWKNRPLDIYISTIRESLKWRSKSTTAFTMLPLSESLNQPKLSIVTSNNSEHMIHDEKLWNYYTGNYLNLDFGYQVAFGNQINKRDLGVWTLPEKYEDQMLLSYLGVSKKELISSTVPLEKWNKIYEAIDGLKISIKNK